MLKNQAQFLPLANSAPEYLSKPGTAVPSERAWSHVGNITSSRRQSIPPANSER